MILPLYCFYISVNAGRSVGNKSAHILEIVIYFFFKNDAITSEYDTLEVEIIINLVYCPIEESARVVTYRYSFFDKVKKNI